mgnify:CR=1 FL=1
MATTTHIGIGVVWGITQTGGTVTLAGTGVGRIVSETVTNEAKSMEHLNGDGDLVGVCFYDYRTQIELEVYPSGPTLALAQTALNACPSPGSAVVLKDLYLDRVGKTDTTYLCMASSIRESNTDRVTISMTLCKAANLTVSQITPP